MNTGRTTPLLLGLVLLAACDGSHPAGAPGVAGRLELRRSSPDAASLLNAPASATWCESDSLLAVVGITADGVGGVAVRVPWPITAPDTFAVARAPGVSRTARVAFRALDDSVRSAFVADSGLMALRGDSAVSGTIVVSGTAGDSTRVSVRGRITNVRVVPACPSSGTP